MKPRHIGTLTLVGVIILIVFQSGCGLVSKSQAVPGSKDRAVTISPANGSSSPCEVDYPVVFLKKSKHQTITWFAPDIHYDYWVFFPNGSPFGSTTAIKVPKGKDSGKWTPTSTSPPTYYIYAIYDKDPGPNPAPGDACKLASANPDPGLNVKD